MTLFVFIGKNVKESLTYAKMISVKYDLKELEWMLQLIEYSYAIKKNLLLIEDDDLEKLIKEVEHFPAILGEA